MWRRPAFVGLLLVVGCGAYDDVSTPVLAQQDCATVNSRLETLTTLVESGQLAGIQAAFSDDLGPDVRTRLVALIFDVLDQYPPGTFTRLSPAVETGTVEGLIALISGPLDTVIKTEAWPAVAAIGQLLQQCTGRPLLITLRALLDEPAVRADLETLLAGSLDLTSALDTLGIDLTTLQGRVGFQALLRSLVISITQPDFDIVALTGPDGLLRLLAPPGDPTLDALVRIVDTLLAPGESLTSIQLLTDCLLDVDSDDLLFGLVFDLVVAPSSGAVPSIDLYPGGPLETIDRLLLPLLDLLIGDEAVRRSAVVVLSTLLQPKVASRFVPDILVLVAAGAGQDVLELIVQFARGGGC